MRRPQRKRTARAIKYHFSDEQKELWWTSVDMIRQKKMQKKRIFLPKPRPLSDEHWA